jgi:pyroglutamyl-peptidase
MKRVLVLGFEPFGGESQNPSADVAQALNGTTVGGAHVVGRVIPCVFGECRQVMLTLLKEVKPDLVIAFGLGGGRSDVTPERVAINVDDARIADNKGNQPIDTKIAAKGPTAYWSTLPIKAIVENLTKKGIPASVSQTAGTFVCNHLFYSVMHALKTKPGVSGGFIHVPFLPSQAKGRPSLPIETTIEAARIAIETSLRIKKDVARTGGATQ